MLLTCENFPGRVIFPAPHPKCAITAVCSAIVLYNRNTILFIFSLPVLLQWTFLIHKFVAFRFERDQMQQTATRDQTKKLEKEIEKSWRHCRHNLPWAFTGLSGLGWKPGQRGCCACQTFPKEYFHTHTQKWRFKFLRRSPCNECGAKGDVWVQSRTNWNIRCV